MELLSPFHKIHHNFLQNKLKKKKKDFIIYHKLQDSNSNIATNSHENNSVVVYI